MKSTVIIGYSGHSYVVIDAFLKQNKNVLYYLDTEEKDYNPYNLTYLGKEDDQKNLEFLQENAYFVSIGDNYIRKKITDFLVEYLKYKPRLIIHQRAILATKIEIEQGVFVGANAIINPLVKIGKGTIINTNAVIEHECRIGEFCHIAPSATLCGNIEVGNLSFIGANTVIKQGVKIGENVVVGAGSVVIRDIPDNMYVAGNPVKNIKYK